MEERMGCGGRRVGCYWLDEGVVGWGEDVAQV